MSRVTVSDPALSRTRRKLVAFAVLAVVAVVVGSPAWTVAALVSTSLAIPVAVALDGGGAHLRDLLLPGPAASSVVTTPGRRR
ncbi:hypothetical protein GA0070616_4463 [Micromonospora nigra]|uniref:Uncharacterized protein n=1 Tax=Micromonospora nigra TaxID=145857 RepID=A0A1C6SSG7_9ACTN|nr:hypothetical protein [Micromonospora nigra]SCL32430.1 hypothetical protein GA0070616_4463 [Micromonospora nigra]